MTASVSETDAKRYDPEANQYALAELWERAGDYLNWFAAVAFACYVALHVSHRAGDDIAKLLFVFFSMLAILIGYVHRYMLLPDIDGRRRLLMISDSLGETLTFERQRDFWTTTVAQSPVRFAISLAENSFFYSRLLGASKRKLLALVGVLILAMLIALREGTAEMVELVAVVLLCSDAVGGRLVRVIWASGQYNMLHSRCIALLTQWPDDVGRQNAEVLALFGEYESIKSRSSVRASDRTFDRLNPLLTPLWEQTRTEIEKSLYQQGKAVPMTVPADDPPAHRIDPAYTQ